MYHVSYFKNLQDFQNAIVSKQVNNIPGTEAELAKVISEFTNSYQRGLIVSYYEMKGIYNITHIYELSSQGLITHKKNIDVGVTWAVSMREAALQLERGINECHTDTSALGGIKSFIVSDGLVVNTKPFVSTTWYKSHVQQNFYMSTLKTNPAFEDFIRIVETLIDDCSVMGISLSTIKYLDIKGLSSPEMGCKPMWFSRRETDEDWVLSFHKELPKLGVYDI